MREMKQGVAMVSGTWQRVKSYLNRMPAGRLSAILMAVTGILACPALMRDAQATPGQGRIALRAGDTLACSLSAQPADSAIQAIFAGQLTGGAMLDSADQIIKWDAAEQRYVTAFKAGNGIWMDAEGGAISAMTLEPGEGFFVRSGQRFMQHVQLPGGDVAGGTSAIPIASGLNLIGYPYASVPLLNGTDLAASGATAGASPEEADKIIDHATGEFAWLKAGESAGWVGADGVTPAFKLEAGKAYWYLHRGEGFLWSEERPQDDVSVTAVAQGRKWKTGQILVKPRRGTSEAEFRGLLSSHGARQRDSIHQINVRIVSVPEDKADRVIEALSRNQKIEFAERDGYAEATSVPNDPLLVNAWHLQKINAIDAWAVNRGGPSTIIAIVDSGIIGAHPDLAGKVMPGFDFADNDSDPTDAGNHGTKVAGVAAAATDNSVGVAGAAWDCSILPVKVADSSLFYPYSACAKGITYAADRGARIINMSFGGTSSSSALQSAVDYAWGKDAILIAAAGNAGSTTPYYPAACRNVVAVSATNPDDTLRSTSSFGSFVDIAAPGSSIVSTTFEASDPTRLYASSSGTSFASPIVAGVAALIASARTDLTNAQIVDVLLSTADDLGATGWDQYFGQGRVNAGRALAAVADAVVPPPVQDTAAPSVAVLSPSSGATVSGVVSVSVSATDATGVTKVGFYVNGVLNGSANAASAVFSWSTEAVANGSYTLTARAYDAAGNVGISAEVTVTVSNVVIEEPADTTPPVAVVTSPAGGSKLAANQKITIAASDDVGVARVELWIDGALFGSATRSPATFTWNTKKAAAGAHTLQARAYDAAGNAGSSAIVTVYK